VVEHVGHGAYRIDLPEVHCHTHPVFNNADTRPWLTSDMHVLEQHFPAVPLHPSVNPFIQVFDRSRSPGRVPRDLPVEDMPATYLVIRRDGTQEWVFKIQLNEQEQWKIVQFKLLPQLDLEVSMTGGPSVRVRRDMTSQSQLDANCQLKRLRTS
jgi:hypothetical protein